MAQHEGQGNQTNLIPFPGFIINNKNDNENHTPISKIPCGSIPNSANSTEQTSSTTTTKTPPAEPSISPEIQSNFHVSSTAISTCYGAGHVISGVVDKRKCKSRGILSGHKKSINSEETINCVSYDKLQKDILTKSRPSLIPYPVEASISWNLSPSFVDESKDDNDVKLVESSPSSHCGPPCKLELSSEKFIKKLSQEERPLSFDFHGEFSPFSADSLGSMNVMQTPNSDSSLENHASLSYLKEGIQLKHKFESEIDQVTSVSLSPEDTSSPWDPPRLSAELADLDLSSPSSLPNPNHLREKPDIHESLNSNSTSVNMSESEIRVSWKDGLINTSFDKEDLDCCNLLSDEEIDADENGKQTSFSVKPNTCAESIHNDDGGLIASGDSDWTHYY